MLVDSHNRIINYLRLSVTDRCNLSCRYCVPLGGAKKLHHSEILRYEELLRLAGILSRLGIRKIRVTGGEPLTRRGLSGFLGQLGAIPGLEEICLTTNGVLLSSFLDDIYLAGVRKVNISLDTLDPKKYAEITGNALWAMVWESIQKALTLENLKVKINLVLMKGVNDSEIARFAELTFLYPLEVRFIEFMPVGCGNRWNYDVYLSGEKAMRIVEEIGSLAAISKEEYAGPARSYRLSGAIGEIGFINAVSSGFCRYCNRIRITPDGQLRVCLFSDYETDLKACLRGGFQDESISQNVMKAVKMKPAQHASGTALAKQCRRQMSQIGG